MWGLQETLTLGGRCSVQKEVPLQASVKISRSMHPSPDVQQQPHPPWAPKAKKPLTHVSKRLPGVRGKRGLERGWQKRLAKGWRRVGERVGMGLADFLAPSNFAILETPV